MTVDQDPSTGSLDVLRERVDSFLGTDVEDEEAVWTYTVPTPADVAGFYDRHNRVMTDIFGGSMHYGYWTGPDDPSDLVQAGARLTAVMIDKLRVSAGDTVLDLGCGTGRPGVELARVTGATVTGVSLSGRDVELATERAAAEGVAARARFQRANALELPFPDASFDAVLALESILHIEDRRRVLAEVARVLRPGGRIALTDCVRRGLVEPDEETELAVKRMLAAWSTAPLVRIADYPGIVADAGLVLDELIDVTDHTKYTIPHTHARITELLSEGRDVPEDLAEIMSQTDESDWAIDEDVTLTEGYAIVVAHRPRQA